MIVELPRTRGGWRCLIADPPWQFNDSNTRGAAERHYETMGGIEIANMPVREIIAADAVLGLWTPDTHLELALAVAKAWGFTYRHLVPWTKVSVVGKLTPKEIEDGYCARFGLIRIGTGHYMRKAHEVALLCTKGKPEILDHGVASPILAPRGEHSAKPVDLHEKLERLCAGPRLELFAREARAGWAGWGVEYISPGGNNGHATGSAGQGIHVPSTEGQPGQQVRVDPNTREGDGGADRRVVPREPRTQPGAYANRRVGDVGQRQHRSKRVTP